MGGFWIVSASILWIEIIFEKNCVVFKCSWCYWIVSPSALHPVAASSRGIISALYQWGYHCYCPTTYLRDGIGRGSGTNLNGNREVIQKNKCDIILLAVWSPQFKSFFLFRINVSLFSINYVLLLVEKSSKNVPLLSHVPYFVNGFVWRMSAHSFDLGPQNGWPVCKGRGKWGVQHITGTAEKR